MINYYKDMWQGRAHILAPLTAITGKNSMWDWNQENK